MVSSEDNFALYVKAYLLRKNKKKVVKIVVYWNFTQHAKR